MQGRPHRSAARAAGRHQGHGRYRGPADHLRLARCSRSSPKDGRGPRMRLRQAGAIAQFKTNTPAWAAGGNTFNPVYGVSGNPFAPQLTCGGSSGGSGIALAAGMLPLAHGSDNAGSLRIPASFCGVAGMRPTAGLVPHERRVYGPAALSVEGPMGRDVRDTALLLSVLASDDPRDPLASHLDPALRAELAPLDLSKLRLAFSADLGGFAPIDARRRDLFQRRIGELAPHFGSAADASPDLRDADFVYETQRAVLFVGTWHKRMQEMPDKWGAARHGQLPAGADSHRHANRRRQTCAGPKSIAARCISSASTTCSSLRRAASARGRSTRCSRAEWPTARRRITSTGSR